MKKIITTLISLAAFLAIVSCQPMLKPASGTIPISSEFSPNSANDVVAYLGVPAEVYVTLPAGPFFEPTRVLSYYTEDDDGVIRRKDYHFVDDQFRSGALYSPRERILSADTQENIRKISEYKAKLGQ